MYIFASQDFSFCFGNVGTQRLPSRLLGLETAQTTHAGSADRRKGRQIYQSPMWGCAYKMLVINHAVLCEFKHLNRINITIFKSL